jgi:hypothetical protein
VVGLGSNRRCGQSRAIRVPPYSGAVEVSRCVWVYQITKNGVALQLTLQGTKYYKDDDLNKS